MSLTFEQVLFVSDAVLATLATGAAIPSVVLLAECAASLLPTRSTPLRSDLPRPRVALLVPAHNETLHIGQTTRHLVAQLQPGDRLLVIADNCTDDTATVARAAGADVLERTDPINRGKGFALAAGLARLAESPPDVVILFDADVVPPPGAVDTLAAQASQLHRPVQALYLLHSSGPEAGIRATVSELAFIVKNSVRPRGLHRFNLPVPITGTGIALPWNSIADIHLASSDLVEDMKLGLDLLLNGHPPRLCPEVTLHGDLPDTTSAAHTQRTRWEHGHLLTLKRWVLKLALKGLTSARPSLWIAALDLAVPPLALLAMLQCLLAAATLSYGLVMSRWIPSSIVLVSITALALSVLIAWATSARHLSLLKILGTPLYIFWKIPLYFRFLSGRAQTTWVRTDRTSKPNPD